MRRRLNLERLSDLILLALHERFFDDDTYWLTFEEIRNEIKSQPANAIRLELAQLINSKQIRQKTESREKTGFGAGGIQSTTYEVKVDGYRLTKPGILAVEEFPDNYYSDLREELRRDAISANEPSTRQDGWQPIPLDRTDEQQNKAERALDGIIEDLRGDNGYASTNLEEKKFVQDKLSQAAKRLKEDSQISWMYLNEFVLKPLGILINRFGKASVGVAAQVTRDAFTAWLRSKGIHFLDDIFK